MPKDQKTKLKAAIEINERIETNFDEIFSHFQEKAYRDMSVNAPELLAVVTEQIDLGLEPEYVGWRVFRQFRQYWTDSQCIIAAAKHYKRLQEESNGD